MRRLKIILLATMMMGFALLSTANFAHASILGHNWVGTLIKGQTDPFLGYVYAGYETGSSASLIVNVNNHLPDQMNISAVKVWFDWGINYSSTEVDLTNVYAMPTGTSHLFTVTFTVPSTTTASNLVKHNYKIYVEDVNATTGPKKQLNSNPPFDDGDDFAVFSGEQATAIETAMEITKYYGYSMFITAKARELYLMAGGTDDLAYNAYMNGDFSSAAANYQEALELYQYAWGNETESISGFEQALKDLITSAQGQLTMVGWGYITFGIGWIFIGIGVIIYAVRKPKAPATP